MITVVLLSSAVLVHAQDGIQLSLQDAVDIALSENPTIKVANLEIERQDWVRKETAGALLPTLSMSGQYDRSIVKTEMAKGLSFGADNTWTANASLSLPLFAPSVYQTLQMNRLQMANAVEEARASKINMTCEVKKAYYNILLAQRSLEVLHSSQDLLQQTVDNTQNMFDNGLVAEYDLLSAQVQLSSLKPTILQTEMSIESAKLLLKMYLGLPEQVDIILTDDLDDMVSQDISLAETYRTDISENSDLKSLDIQAQMLNRQLKLNNSLRMPVIAAYGSATYTGNDMDLKFDFGGVDVGGGGEEESKSRYWWQHPISGGIQMSIPIFSGFTNIRKNREIENTISQLEFQRDYLEQSLNVQVRNAINTIMTAKESIASTELTEEQADKAYQIATARYKAGAGTILELNASELSLTEARLSYSQAVFNYLAAVADYRKIIGDEETK